MDAKDLRTETTINQRNNDGRNKYAPTDNILQYDRNKPYQDIGSNSSAKVDVTRPCAVIGPDRVVRPQETSDSYLRRNKPEPWPNFDTYTRPPEYPHKLNNYQNPIRNISPRQTFQENMQRVMVPTRYTTAKTNEEHPADRTVNPSKNLKHGVSEVKYCEVPYTSNVLSNEQKNLNNMPVTNMSSSSFPSSAWPSGNTHAPPRPYDNTDLYQYPDYASCAGPKSMPIARPIRTIQDDVSHPYSESYYHTGNLRLKPYATVKERFPPPRYEFATYPNSYPHPPFPPHNYDVHKAMPPHLYNNYPQIPLKYIDNRICDPALDGYQRSLQPTTYVTPLRNQVIHPNYAPMPGTCIPNKLHPFAPADNCKQVTSNKIAFDHNKMFEYGNVRSRAFLPENFYPKDTTRAVPLKSQMMPNYPAVNLQNIHSNPYRKDLRSYEYYSHIKGAPDPSTNNISRLPPQFSPKTLAISPSESNTSNETLYTSQEDCGYASQSSTTSLRSIDSRMYNDYYKRYEYRYGPEFRLSSLPKSSVNANNSNKNKKNIDVRQFLQMWNEGDDEHVENNNKDLITQNISTINSHLQRQEACNDKEQLYVLGLVNVPSDELCKYDHIQKISKLPDNIKGYNNIELLCQFEEAIESSKINNTVKPTIQIENQNRTLNLHSNIPRSISPLDVEAKISQSVIHKDVGCNFEIKPCSPKMLNVEVAAPIQSVTNERMIERVANPHILKSPLILNHMNSNDDNCILNNQDNSKHTVKILGCKMTDSYISNDALSSIKSDYNFQDLEGNSGLCLASLPRLDNDIELNFPEVNQQFIKANQLMTESVITTNSPKNITPVKGDQSSKEVMTESRNSLNSDIYQLSPNSSEKSFTKLSKYRKNKSSFLESKQRDPLIGAQAIRTDSVIIKNPENCKNFEENNSPLSMSKLEDEQNKPINLTTQCYESMTSSNCNNVNDDSTQSKIDFSLNTSDNSNILNTEEDSIASSSLFSAEMFERSDVKLTDIDNGSKYVQDNLENLAKGILRDSEVNEEILNTCNPTDVHKEKLNLENTNPILSNELSMRKFDNKQDIHNDKSELLTYVKNDHVSYESKIPINNESLIGEDFANIINCTDKDEIPLPSVVSNTISYKDTKMVTNINENTCYDNNIESKSLFKKITNNVDDGLKLTDHCNTNNTDTRTTSPCNEKINEEQYLDDAISTKIDNFEFTESIVKNVDKTLKTIHCANLIEKKDICMIMKTSEIESFNTKLHENVYKSNNNCTEDEFQQNKLESPDLYNDLVTCDLNNKEETVVLRLNKSDINNDKPKISVPSTSSNNVSNNSFEGKFYNDLTEKEEINDLIFNLTVTNNDVNTDESKTQANTLYPDLELTQIKENEETLRTIPNENAVKEIGPSALLVQNENDYAMIIGNSIINNDETETNMLSSDINLSKKSCIDMTTSFKDDVVLNEDSLNNIDESKLSTSCENFKPANYYSHNVINEELKDKKENTPLNEQAINRNDNSQKIYELDKMEDMIKNDLEEKEKNTNITFVDNVTNKNHEFQNTLLANIEAKNNFEDRKNNLRTEIKNIIMNDIVIVNSDKSHTRLSDPDPNLIQNCHNNILIEDFKEKKIKNIFTETSVANCDESGLSGKNFSYSKNKRDFIEALDESNRKNAKINHTSKYKVTDTVTDIATNRKAVETYLDNNDKSKQSSPLSDETLINSHIMIEDFSDSKDNINERSVDNISRTNTSCTKVVEITNGNYIASHPGTDKENIHKTETKLICNDIEEDAMIDVRHINNTNFESIVINNFEKSNSKSLFVEINDSDDISTIVANEKVKIDSSFHKNANSICNNTKTMKCVEIVSTSDNTQNVKENKEKINDGEKGEHMMNSYINDYDNNNEKLYNESENYSKSDRVIFENNMGYRYDIENTKPNITPNLIIDTKTYGDHYVMQKEVNSDKKILKSEVLFSESIEEGSLSSSVSTKKRDVIENEDDIFINQHQPKFSVSPKVQKITERSENINLFKNIYNKACIKKELFSSRIQNLFLFNEGKTLAQLPFEFDKLDNNLNLDCRKVIENENKKHLNKILSKDTIPAEDIIEGCNKNSFSSESLVRFSTITANDYVEQQQPLLENEVIEKKTTQNTNVKCNTGNKVKSLKELTEEIVASNNIQIINSNELEFLHEVDINIQTNDIVNSNVQLVEHRDAIELFSKRLKNIKKNKFLRTPKALKRSLSDSALDKYLNDNCVSNASIPKKRKTNLVDNSFETELRTENLCSILHNNRRNSVATFNNGDNVSFCILINNDYLIEEESETIAYPITSENVLNIHEDIVETTTINLNKRQESYHECSEDKSLDESWVDDVACVETVVTDDIAEDVVISASTSPTDFYDSDREFENAIFNSDISDHTDKVKYFYRNHMSSNDAQLVEQLYMTPQMDVTKTLSKSESQHSENYKYYDKESLVKVLSESNHQEFASECDDSPSENAMNSQSKEGLDDKENLDSEVCQEDVTKLFVNLNTNVQCEKHQENNNSNLCSIETKMTMENICESSNDDVFSINHEDSKTKYLSSSSPEVSSTTSEEKNSSIMLKITNYNGSRISHISDNTNDRISCKYTETNTFLYNTSNKPLITKAAQKYIPPIKETIKDLKVRLPLPPNSLNKLKQLKNTKDTSSKDKLQSYKNNITKNNSKKPKPNFEDVLKGIEENQIKMHKEKCRKPKKSVPKVVIKKNEYGSHYASTSNNAYNPDLTGRKWQPWVFLEKNRFIDKMAIRKKTRAVYNHRKKTYVLIEKFYKYKAFSSRKFFISQPKSDDSSQGQLKCTIKLKQNC